MILKSILSGFVHLIRIKNNVYKGFYKPFFFYDLYRRSPLFHIQCDILWRRRTDKKKKKMVFVSLKYIKWDYESCEFPRDCTYTIPYCREHLRQKCIYEEVQTPIQILFNQTCLQNQTLYSKYFLVVGSRLTSSSLLESYPRQLNQQFWI